MLFGGNSYTAGAQTCVRVYHPPEQGIPVTFGDGGAVVPSGIIPCVSVAPPIADILSGSLDAAVGTWLEAAPPGTLVTALHERNLAKYGLEPQQVSAVHDYLADLVGQVAPHVLYGAILDCYPVNNGGQLLEEWFPAGIPWIGLDVYQQAAGQDAADLLNIPLTQLALCTGPATKVLITETNTPLPGQQAAWLTSVMDFAVDHDLAGCLWFAKDTNPVPPMDLLDALGAAAAAAPFGPIGK
jgi:hypothetical protein